MQSLVKAVVRRPAPAFKAMAYWNNEFRELTLEQFRGKSNLTEQNRQIRCALFLASCLYFCVPHRNLPVLRQGARFRGQQHPSDWLLNRLSLRPHGVLQEREKIRRPWPYEDAPPRWCQPSNRAWLWLLDWGRPWLRNCIQSDLYNWRQRYSAPLLDIRPPCWQKRWWSFTSCPSVPAHWQTWWGLSRQLEARKSNNDPRKPREIERILGQRTRQMMYTI